jgi:hypothetical protein
VIRRKKKKYNLLSVSYEVVGEEIDYLPSVIYVAVPRMMPIPSIGELEIIMKKYGYIENAYVFAISNMGEFPENRLPSEGCIKMSRKGTGILSSSIEKIFDDGPKMIRMDWRV